MMDPANVAYLRDWIGDRRLIVTSPERRGAHTWLWYSGLSHLLNRSQVITASEHHDAQRMRGLRGDQVRIINVIYGSRPGQLFPRVPHEEVCWMVEMLHAQGADFREVILP